jgi:hypothetical protein
MPISRTVNGLVIQIPCDNVSQEGWDSWNNIGGMSWTNDTSDKIEGAASQKASGVCPSPSYPGDAWIEHSNTPMNAGNRIHVWHKQAENRHTWTFRAGGHDLFTASATESWNLRSADLPAPADSYVRSRLYPFTGSAGSSFTDWIDHVVISLSRYVVVTGLTQGQKVEVYRASDNTKIDTKTCAAGQNQVSLDVNSEDYPEYMYLKVYATDGITLIETTPNYLMCGGDTWYWVSPYGTLTLVSSASIIIRQDGTGSPKSATLTATLKTQAGSPAPGKTIYFTTSRGEMSPTSAVTDSNGEATSVLTSTTHGIANVKANWPGDADVPAAVNWAMHHVFYNEESGDPTKSFQFFVEGAEYEYTDGSYTLSIDTIPREFNVEIPEWLSTITRRGLVSIYRRGVKEFSGVLTNPDRVMSENPTTTLSGVDSKCLLETRVVTLKDYSAKSISYILADLLSSYPCGITLGIVGAYPDNLTITFADESLVSSVSRLCDVLGWLYRVNPDNSLDLRSAFGSSRPNIAFVQGETLFLAGNSEDYGPVSNSVRMRGSGTLVSTVFDPASIDEIGLIETVAFQKSITNQATLDIAANAELARVSGAAIKIPARVLDDYDVGSWGIDDWVTLTCNDVELSGTYKVVKITRDMKDPEYAEVDFSNKVAYELGDLFDKLKRELKDLNVTV